METTLWDLTCDFDWSVEIVWESGRTYTAVFTLAAFKTAADAIDYIRELCPNAVRVEAKHTDGRSQVWTA